MDNLQITVHFKIHDGNLQEFKRLAEECLAIVKFKDKDTLQYDWFFNQDKTECVLKEIYPDSNALLFHLENIGDLFGQILALADFKAEIYGEPSKDLLNATAGLTIEVYSFYQGLEVSVPAI